MVKKQSGVVDIHGREYKTVALRVTEFRDKYPIDKGYAILTELIDNNEQRCLMRASIVGPEGAVLATGYAEEWRAASRINKAAAIENCETSAIGRALSACGFGGSEYASADELAAKIQAKPEPAKPKSKKITAARAAKLFLRITELSEFDSDLLKKVLSEFGIEQLEQLSLAEAKIVEGKLDATERKHGKKETVDSGEVP